MLGLNFAKYSVMSQLYKVLFMYVYLLKGKHYYLYHLRVRAEAHRALDICLTVLTERIRASNETKVLQSSEILSAIPH